MNIECMNTFINNLKIRIYGYILENISLLYLIQTSDYIDIDF